MPDALTVAARKEQGICTRCGKRPARRKPRATKCQECINETSLATIAAQRANPERYAEIQRERYAEKAKFAICIKCDNPAAPGRKRCEPHLEQARSYAKKLQENKA